MFHTGIISQNTSYAHPTSWVYRRNRYFSPVISKIGTESFDKRTLSYTRNARNPYANGLIGIREAFLNNLMCLLLMFGLRTFDQSNGFAERRNIALTQLFNQRFNI